RDVKLWNGQARLLQTFKGVSGTRRFYFSKDETRIVGVNENRVVGLTLQGVGAGSLPVWVDQSDFDASRATVITASADEATVSNVEGWTTRARFRSPGGTIRDVAISADGRLALTHSQDGSIRLWDTERGRLIAVLREAAPRPEGSVRDDEPTIGFDP